MYIKKVSVITNLLWARVKGKVGGKRRKKEEKCSCEQRKKNLLQIFTGRYWFNPFPWHKGQIPLM